MVLNLGIIAILMTYKYLNEFILGVECKDKKQKKETNE
jgi:hypothetical protein